MHDTDNMCKSPAILHLNKNIWPSVRPALSARRTNPRYIILSWQTLEYSEGKLSRNIRKISLAMHLWLLFPMFLWGLSSRVKYPWSYFYPCFQVHKIACIDEPFIPKGRCKNLRTINIQNIYYQYLIYKIINSSNDPPIFLTLNVTQSWFLTLKI